LRIPCGAAAAAESTGTSTSVDISSDCVEAVDVDADNSIGNEISAMRSDWSQNFVWRWRDKVAKTSYLIERKEKK